MHLSSHGYHQGWLDVICFLLTVITLVNYLATLVGIVVSIFRVLVESIHFIIRNFPELWTLESWYVIADLGIVIFYSLALRILQRTVSIIFREHHLSSDSQQSTLQHWFTLGGILVALITTPLVNFMIFDILSVAAAHITEIRQWETIPALPTTNLNLNDGLVLSATHLLFLQFTSGWLEDLLFNRTLE